MPSSTPSTGASRNWRIEVDVCTRRPPTAQHTLTFILAPETPDPELWACQWAQDQTGVTMAVGSRVIDWPEEGT